MGQPPLGYQFTNEVLKGQHGMFLKDLTRFGRHICPAMVNNGLQDFRPVSMA